MDDFGQIFKVQNTDGYGGQNPSKATAIGTLLQAGGMVSSASDNLVFPYSAEPGNQNPKYELIELVGGTQILFFASNYMLKPMQEHNDPVFLVILNRVPTVYIEA